MEQLIIIVHVIAALLLIALVLVQHGKGADAGAAFGSGASNTMFGSQGAMPFLMKVTVITAAIFFLTSLTIGYLIANSMRANTAVSTSTMPSSSSQQKNTEEKITFPSVNVAPQQTGEQKK